MTVVPLDVIKSRIQNDNPANPKYKVSTFFVLHGLLFQSLKMFFCIKLHLSIVYCLSIIRFYMGVNFEITSEKVNFCIELHLNMLAVLTSESVLE